MMTQKAQATGSAVILLILGTLLSGCDRSATPGGPVGTEGSGTLEVTVTVNGTRPDADGYALLLALASREQSAEPIESIGGTVQFAYVPTGTHTVRLDGLAANCSVKGSNPLVFTIDPDETLTLRFSVHCAGPGLLLVRTVGEGSDLDADGYALAIETSSTRHERIGQNDSLLIQAEEDSADGSWTLWLSEVEHQCIVEPQVTPASALVDATDALEVRILADVTVGVTYRVTCLNRSSRIAFGTAGDIYLIPPGGGSQAAARNLTRHSAHDTNPALSPDGSRIVFSSSRDGSIDLYSLNTDGGDLIRLTHDTEYEWIGPQAWSPDGSRIVYSRTQGDSLENDLYLMNADGTGVVRLTQNGSGSCSPAWSPGGDWIAFCKGGVVMRMRPIAGSETHVIANGGTSPAWSPSGSSVALFMSHGGHLDLVVIRVDGTELGRLHPNPAHDVLSFSPTWSPDGSWIAFTRGEVASEVSIVRFNGTAFGQVMRIAEGYQPSWR